MSRLAAVLETNRANAVVAWSILGLLALAIAASIVLGEPVWAVFVVVGVVIFLLPAVVRRDPRVMPPWEVLAFAALPMTSQFLALPDVLADLTVFLAILAVAVVVVVELQVFSPVRMTPRFAVGFVVCVTMATAGVWAILQYAADASLGTSLIESKTSLMWDLVLATAIGLGGTPFFALYFRWLDASDVRAVTEGVGG